MAKNSILDYDTTPDNNTDINSVGIQGTSAVNNFDNAFRTIMAHLADFTGGSTIASGTTTDLSTVKGQYVTVSGTSTITSFGTAKAGWMKYLRFTGVATITYNATSMILPGAASITTSPGDYALFVSEGSGNWRCLDYFSSLSGARPAPKGQFYGLTLSNNAGDAVNDIDIAAGEVASDAATPSLIILAASITKRLDAAWAVGTGNGGRDTGAIADGTWHVWLIQRSDTGVVDALFSLSATSPTMPTSYDRKAYVGPIIRSGGTILGFTQLRDDFTLNTYPIDRSSTSALASSLLTITVPTGIPVEPKLALVQENLTSGNIQTKIGTAGKPTSTALITKAAGDAQATLVTSGVTTNTSAQIQFEVQVISGSLNLNVLTTMGWVDRRGRK